MVKGGGGGDSVALSLYFDYAYQRLSGDMLSRNPHDGSWPSILPHPPPLPNHTKPTVSRPVKSHRYSAMSLLKVVPTS